MKNISKYIFYAWMGVLLFTIGFSIISIFYGILTGKI